MLDFSNPRVASPHRKAGQHHERQFSRDIAPASGYLMASRRARL
jgi:hypothetical protein